MAIPPAIEAELDAAYDLLNALVDQMEEDGHDPRAIIGGMGRLYIQLMNAELSPEERHDMAGHITKALGGQPN